MDDCDQLSQFLLATFTAWGRDRANDRLWGGLNLTLTMWLWRAMVMQAYSAKVKQLTPETFTKCLMTISSNQFYQDWLVGRQLSSPRDVPQAYSKIKAIFAIRLEQIGGSKTSLPAPQWAASISATKTRTRINNG